MLSVYLLPRAALGLNISWTKAKVFRHAVGSLDPRMYFAKLRNIITKSPLTSSRPLLSPISSSPSQAAGSTPTHNEGRSVQDAATRAISTNINAPHIINDSTAVALGYRITKTDLPDADSPHHVVFVVVGHSSMSESVSVVTFSKGQLQVVKGTGYGA